MHNASVVQLGTTRSNHRVVTQHGSDPASFKAGFAVSRNSSGDLSLLKSAGLRIGVSLGRDGVATAKGTAVARKGLQVPMRLALKRATGVITVTSYANLVAVTPDTVTVGATVFTAQSGAVTPGGATFQAATSNNATATSLAAQINAHAVASTKVWASVNGAIVTLYSRVSGAGSTGTGNDIVLAYADLGSSTIGITLSGLSGGKLSGGSDTPSSIAYATVGSKVYINDVTGEADINMAGFSTISDAVYCDTGILASLEEDGTAGPPVSYIDFQGGL